MSEKPYERIVSVVNPKGGGGEALMFATDVFLNSDGEHFLNTEIHLQSFCNEAVIRLAGAQLSPSFLRQLANEIDEGIAKAKAQFAVEKASTERAA